jgi:hypothetical protein
MGESVGGVADTVVEEVLVDLTVVFLLKVPHAEVQRVTVEVLLLGCLALLVVVMLVLLVKVGAHCLRRAAGKNGCCCSGVPTVVLLLVPVVGGQAKAGRRDG